MVRVMSRLKNKLHKTGMLCMVIILLVCSFSLEARAEVQEPTYDMSEIYEINMARPAVGDNDGYATFLLENKNTGYKIVYCFFWHQFHDTNDAYMTIDIDSSMIVFNDRVYSTSLFYLTSDGQNTPSKLNIDDNYYTTYSFNYGSSYRLLGWNVYGNCLGVTSPTVSNYKNFDVLFTGEYLQIDLLAKIYRCLDAIMFVDSDILSSLADVLDECKDMNDYLDACVDYLNSIETELKDIGVSLDEINSKYDQLLNYEKNKYSLLTNMKNKIDGIASAISAIKLNIDKFFKNQNSVDMQEMEFNNGIDSSSSKLDSLNQENQVSKVDVNTAAGDVDSNIDFDSMTHYGGVLAVITSHERVVPFILAVFAIALVSYVLFGKR